MMSFPKITHYEKEFLRHNVLIFSKLYLLHKMIFVLRYVIAYLCETNQEMVSDKNTKQNETSDNNFQPKRSSKSTD